MYTDEGAAPGAPRSASLTTLLRLVEGVQTRALGCVRNLLPWLEGAADLGLEPAAQWQTVWRGLCDLVGRVRRWRGWAPPPRALADRAGLARLTSRTVAPQSTGPAVVDGPTLLAEATETLWVLGRRIDERLTAGAPERMPEVGVHPTRPRAG